MDDLQVQVITDEDVAADLSRRALSFYIENVLYGLPLTNVLEIIGVQPIAKVPGTPEYVKGIINLRGGIVPVVDMRLKFGKPEKDYDDLTSIIITLLNNMTVGIIVDRVSNVVDLDTVEMSDLPQFSTVNTNRYMTSVAKVDDELLMNLDCETILEDDNILSMM